MLTTMQRKGSLSQFRIFRQEVTRRSQKNQTEMSKVGVKKRKNEFFEKKKSTSPKVVFKN